MSEDQTFKTRALIFEEAATNLPSEIPCPKCKGGMATAPPPSKWACDGCSRVCEQVQKATSCRKCNVDYCVLCASRMNPKQEAAQANVQLPTGEGAPHIVNIQGRKQINWRRLRELLPWDRAPASVQKRKELFMQVDVNGNGLLSLAEVDKGLRDIFRIDEIFNCKPVIIRAFNAVKAVHQGVPPPGNLGERCRAIQVDPADYVERSEWRLMLLYLYSYFELWELFEIMDTDHDRRISFEEFKTNGVPLLTKLGVKITSPEAAFKQIDADGGGMILFKEFSDWALKIHLNDHIGHDGEYE